MPSIGERLPSRQGTVTDPETVIKTILCRMSEGDLRISLFAAVDSDKIPFIDLRDIGCSHHREKS